MLRSSRPVKDIGLSLQRPGFKSQAEHSIFLTNKKQ